MSFNANGSMSRRNNPFARASPWPSSTPQAGPGVGRPKSTVFSSTASFSASSTPPSHTRSYSRDSPAPAPAPALAPALAPLAPLTTLAPSPDVSVAPRRHSRETSKHGSFASGTFAPAFIKTEDMRRSPDAVSGIEGENDFSGKRYVWLKDPQQAFVKGWIIEDLEGNRIRVQCEDGKVSGLHNLNMSSRGEAGR
jgi:myosin heavy chain 9/10/11/14